MLLLAVVVPLGAAPGVPVVVRTDEVRDETDEVSDGSEELEEGPAPDPPAALDNWANPTAGGFESLKTEYTFFYTESFSLYYDVDKRGH